MAVVDKSNVAAVGRAIYNEKILPTLGPEDKGRVVVIDVKSGDYEIARNSLTATLRLQGALPRSLHLGGTRGVAGGFSPGIAVPQPAMIRGKVVENADGLLQPWLTVSVEYANEGLRLCDVIVDTGFTDFLVLPEDVIKELGLVSEGRRLGTLASGETHEFSYYLTRALWHGEMRWVEVIGSTDQSLLGMELLRDSRIGVESWDGGEVIVLEPMTARVG